MNRFHREQDPLWYQEHERGAMWVEPPAFPAWLSGRNTLIFMSNFMYGSRRSVVVRGHCRARWFIRLLGQELNYRDNTFTSPTQPMYRTIEPAMESQNPRRSTP